MATFSSRRTLLVFALACLLSSTAAHAEPLEAGTVYKGPRRLDVEMLRTSFQLSKGLSGTLRGETFVMGHATKPGLILALSRLQIQSSELMAELQGPIPVDESVSLLLDGKVRKKGNKYSASYRGPGVVGAVIARRHAASGRAVAFISVAQSPSALAALKPLAQKMAASVRFRALPKANATWKKRLSGKVFRSFNTTDTTTSKKTLTFCPDGRYTFRSSSSGSSVSYGGTGTISSGVSFAGQGGSGGTWTVVGNGANTTLQLTDLEAGEVYGFALARNAKGHWLFEGKRWLHDASTPARCPK